MWVGAVLQGGMLAGGGTLSGLGAAPTVGGLHGAELSAQRLDWGLSPPLCHMASLGLPGTLLGCHMGGGPWG